ncbi:MAG: phosphate ABC transporter permease PstA [Hyphomicrobiales bacterium]|jgi:phosphate transport system permease protein|nr:phosphate ABC transporter permease PstA [Hyphomicrobiales bacterium]
MTDIKPNIRLKKRYRAEVRFKIYCASALAIGMIILLTLISSITISAIPAFTQINISIDVQLEDDDIQTFKENPTDVSWRTIQKKSIYKMFPEITSRSDKRELNKIVSTGAYLEIEKFYNRNRDLIKQTNKIYVPAADDIDLIIKNLTDRDLPENMRTISDKQLSYLDTMIEEDRIKKSFSWRLFSNGDSREPELAGLKGGIVGTLLTMFVTLIISFPVGVLAAVYLEEIAPKNRLTDIIEVNINNLAAVPSIVYGLLGLAIFLNYMNMPRSAPLVGGIVLALMTLPVIIIATRASLASIPPSIREAAYGVGASQMQVITHHVVPLALPGILTGTIIGIARAAGETAPLLMIGMMAFIVDIPTGITDKATVLPAQVYMWANNPERSFEYLTSAAILVLLVILIVINLLAIILRKKYERRW